MRKKETTTQRKRRLEKAKLKRQERIANESDVQKRHRLEKRRLAVAKYRQNKSLEQRTIRQDIDINQIQERRKKESKEHLAWFERLRILRQAIQLTKTTEECIVTAKNERQKRTRNIQCGNIEYFNNAINTFWDKVCNICTKRCYPHQVTKYKISAASPTYLPRELLENKEELILCYRCNNHIHNIDDTSTLNMDIPIEIIKQEEQILHEDEMQSEIKLEAQVPEDTTLDENIQFQNIQLEIKVEEEITDSKNYDSISKTDEMPDGQYIYPKSEIICDEKPEMNEECVLGDSLVTYDYPNFGENDNDEELDDRYFDSSIDSSKAAALARVEACLQDIKCETEAQYKTNEKGKFKKINIKKEPDVTVTETHLISNKLINTTSTVTNTCDGLIESQTTKTLVMEILPMSHTNMPFSKLNLNSNPEEILPTPYHYDDTCIGFDDTFQLNSITGNVLSLEQEAYSLLKAKNKKKDPGGKLFTCPKCPKTYAQKKHLNIHLKVHTSIEKRELGFIKGQKTRRKNREMKLKAETVTTSIKKEEKIKKEGGYECTCGQVFRRRSRMETCLKSHNLHSDTDSYPCVSCSKHFRSKEELSLHRKRLHRKRFPCKFCPTDYLTRKDLFKHLQVHQKVQLMEYKAISEVVKGKQKLKCFICSKSFKELPDLKSHVMEDHKQPYSCPRCAKTFSKIIEFGHHTKTSHPEVEGQSVLDVLEAFSKLVKAWKCEECGLQFHEADKLAKHKIEKHSPDIKIESQFQCDDCRRVFITQKGLTSHRRIHHSVESAEVTEPVEEGVMCLECRKICKDMNALASHTRFHSPERKYPCKFCDFRFATAEKRKAHAEIHTGDMKYVCFICEYQCSSENRLKQHKMSLKHLNMKEFLLTGKPLIDEDQSMSKEEKIKETLENKQWVVKKKKKNDSSSSDYSEVACDICGDKFQNESEMLEHKQTHPFIEFPNEDTPSRIFFK